MYFLGKPQTVVFFHVQSPTLQRTCTLIMHATASKKNTQKAVLFAKYRSVLSCKRIRVRSNTPYIAMIVYCLFLSKQPFDIMNTPYSEKPRRQPSTSTFSCVFYSPSLPSYLPPLSPFLRSDRPLWSAFPAQRTFPGQARMQQCRKRREKKKEKKSKKKEPYHPLLNCFLERPPNHSVRPCI